MKVTKKQLQIAGVVAGLVILFAGYTSCSAISKWKGKALAAETLAENTQEAFKQLDESTKKELKAKDEIIAKAQAERAKLIAERDKFEYEKNTIAAKYNSLLGSISTMPPNSVVDSISSYIQPEKATLLASNEVKVTQVGAQFTLQRFVEGRRDLELLGKEKDVTTNLTNQNNTLLTEKAALKTEVDVLKKDLNDPESGCKAALAKTKTESDAWEKTAKKSMRWEKVERGGMVLAILVTVLKIAKVF